VPRRGVAAHPTTPRDALIRDRSRRATGAAHFGQSESLFVNAATWDRDPRHAYRDHERGSYRALTRLIGVGGEPLIRKASTSDTHDGEQSHRSDHRGRAGQRSRDGAQGLSVLL